MPASVTARRWLRTVRHSTTTATATAPAKPVFHILPASLGSGYGMLAIGTS
jgi:hypothetical protein